MPAEAKRPKQTKEADRTVTPALQRKPVIRLGKLGKLNPAEVRRAVAKVKRAHEERANP